MSDHKKKRRWQRLQSMENATFDLVWVLGRFGVKHKPWPAERFAIRTYKKMSEKKRGHERKS